MGSCASVHHKSSSSESAAAMKLEVSFGSKTNNKLVIPPSPVKDKFHSSTFRDYGSKEENFFDSRAYLESDCEDDFYSVNGDFTPSRGSTPVHHSFSIGTPHNGTSGSAPEPSPTKKKLVELFRESLREYQEVDVQNTSSDQNTDGAKIEVKPSVRDVLPKSANETPYASGANSLCSSERTTNGDDVLQREKSLRSVQCCLPSLVSCRSFTDRKKKMSPAIAVNGKT